MNHQSDIPKLILESLSERIPVIPTEAVGFYKQNCMVCFHKNGHRSGVNLLVRRETIDLIFEVYWTGDVNEQIVRSYGDSNKTIDFAACTIALLLIRELTEYTAFEQSALGTTIDYYLTIQGQENDLIFNRAARLEASGILTENQNNNVDNRINQKIRRLKPEGDLPNFIVVVEFSKPWSKMVEK